MHLIFLKKRNPKKKRKKKVLESSIGKGVSGAPYAYSIVIIYHYAIGKLWLATCTRNTSCYKFLFQEQYSVMDNCKKIEYKSYGQIANK